MLMKLRIVSDCKLPNHLHLPVFFYYSCESPLSLYWSTLVLQSVNAVVPRSEVLSTAISLAQQVASNSPDAVQSSKVALLLSQKHNFAETFTTHGLSPESRRVYKGANIKVLSFLFYLRNFYFFAFVKF